MADDADKRKKKEALDRWKAEQRATARSKLPLPDEQMKALFDMLDQEYPRQGCDHTLRLTRAWLAEAVLRPLYAFCLYRVGGDTHRCEEVVQETLVRALRDLERYDPARSCGNIFPWLTGLARNEISRVLARDRRSLSLDALWTRIDRELLPLYQRLEAEPLDEELLRREETCQLVDMTLSQLPPRYREALEAKYVHGVSVRDLAVLWHSTEKAVESQLSRAQGLSRHLSDTDTPSQRRTFLRRGLCYESLGVDTRR